MQNIFLFFEKNGLSSPFKGCSFSTGLKDSTVDTFKKVSAYKYDQTNFSVLCTTGITESFEVGNDLRQGCLMTPDVFSLFINDTSQSIGEGFRVGFTSEISSVSGCCRTILGEC